MDETLQQAARWREEGKRVALASVVATRRSAPRPIGSKLVVSEQGELAGSVSGGCVESDVVVEELRDAERPDVTLTVVEGEGVGERLHDPGLEQAARRRGRSHAFPLGERTVFADVDAPPPRLFVYGAVDTAEALCRAAKLLGWSTVVADARASFATPERIPSADELLVVWPDEALAHVGPDVDTAVLVLTHDDKFDLPLLEAVLRTDAFYVGALGSRRNQERRRGLLLERGVDEDDLDRIAGPAGLDLGADTPAETALSMLAEILAVRAGRAGGRLRESPHRIHAEPVS